MAESDDARQKECEEKRRGGKESALAWIRELRRHPEGEWQRRGDEAMTRARKADVTLEEIAEAADLPL